MKFHETVTICQLKKTFLYLKILEIKSAAGAKITRLDAFLLKISTQKTNFRRLRRAKIRTVYTFWLARIKPVLNDSQFGIADANSNFWYDFPKIRRKWECVKIIVYLVFWRRGRPRIGGRQECGHSEPRNTIVGSEFCKYCNSFSLLYACSRHAGHGSSLVSECF